MALLLLSLESVESSSIREQLSSPSAMVYTLYSILLA